MADMNGDGLLDIIAANEEQSNLGRAPQYLACGRGVASFGALQTFMSEASASAWQ